MEALGINLGLLIVQIIAFIIVFISLSAWVYKPLLNMMEARRKKIAQGMEDAQVASEARANAEKDAASIVAEAQTKATHIISEATDRANAAMVDIKTDSEKEISKMREASLVEVEEERNRILGELRGQVAALAIAAAQKLVGETLDEKRQHVLLAEFFSGVKSGKVVVLEGAEISGASAEVVSALPLTEDERVIVRKDVLAKMGTQTVVDFRVDPSILGGLVIYVGDKVLDGSVAGQLDDLHKSMK
jgi:F-type H+-transporting ATPase subunit b